MKTVAIILLSLFVSFAHAEKINLEGGDVERQAICTQGKKKMLCVAVRKDGELYVVALDEKGEYCIYHIGPKGNVLLWSRDSI